MLHLLQRGVNPKLSLEKSIEEWYSISCALREPPRERVSKIEEIESKE